MSRMGTTFGKSYASRCEARPIPNTRNADGYPAHTLPLEHQYYQMLMTNTLGNVFYANSRNLVQGSKRMHRAMLKTDSLFMARAIKNARTEGYMRMQPIIGLAYLSLDKSQNRWVFKKIFNNVIRTVKDLIDFVTFLETIRNGRGLGRKVKSAINSWLLLNLTEYQAIKYGGDKGVKLVCGSCGYTQNPGGHVQRCPKCRSNDVRIKTFWTLRDIIRVTRPKPVTPFHESLFRYIVRGLQYHDIPQLPQISCVEELKEVTRVYNQGETEKRRYLELVRTLVSKGRLPYEVVIGIVAPVSNVWEYLMKQMPMFALLRHLNTLQRHDVFNERNNVKYVCSRLTDKNAIAKSMIWPNQIARAYRNYGGNTEILDALREMADTAFSNLPKIPGITKFFLDISGSMNGNLKEHGAILGMGALRNSEDAEFWCFGTELWYPRISTRDCVLTNVDRVVDMDGGGTNIGMCMEHMLGQINNNRSDYYYGGYERNVPMGVRSNSPVFADNIIILTDEQQNAGTPLIKKFREYRRTVNPDAKLFIIDVSPYHEHVADADEPGVYFIFGWSDEVLRHISFVCHGMGDQLESVRQTSLD